MKKLFLAVLIVGLALVVFAPVALAAPSGDLSADVKQELIRVAKANARYKDYEKALADGFINTGECVEVPGLGGMGVHFVHIGRIMDPAINSLEPEALLYVPTSNGYVLVGVEYIFAIGGPGDPIPDSPPPAPVLFGVPFDGPMLGHGPGDGPHYDLHAWIYRANPNGTFTQFNPTVDCP